MILTYAVFVCRSGEGVSLLPIDVEVDLNLGLGDLGVRSKAPFSYGVLRGWNEEGVTGLDLGVGDGPVGLDSDHEDDLSADVHAVGEFGIDGIGAGDDGSMNAACKGGAGAE